ncbi:helix-turn-helix domain-containing protein (plasmid) [Mycolicibacterium crocinum]|uniref:Helix-turn-helix domain-containing protein n=1 Tax=Mycolicibacterium crocinum TaxID=388459 RepID=A0ABY3U120_9MYCO|nr:helix-turn-helix domain-containing protein [Mycolicibacterium crocinum]ULN44854.1 helix-turn-helix domain-containing protein [Mycolicibacterium crocinum]
MLSRQGGIPFRPFVSWARIEHVIDAVRRADDLTENAVRAGFSDSAHLSRLFRANFGIALSAVLHRISFAADLRVSRNCRNVQARDMGGRIIGSWSATW